MLYKKLKVDDISSYINTGKRFKPLHELLELKTNLNIHEYMKNLRDENVA